MLPQRREALGTGKRLIRCVWEGKITEKYFVTDGRPVLGGHGELHRVRFLGEKLDSAAVFSERRGAGACGGFVVRCSVAPE